MTKEEEVFGRHLLDLADLAWQRNIAVFSDFLNLNEQNIYHNMQKSFYGVRTEGFGGYEHAERQMIAFLPDALCRIENGGSEQNVRFPIACLKIAPLNARFAEDLSHRDYLGALMNLGIDRAKLGDIVLQDRDAYLFCEKKMADYLSGELTRVRHTAVSCHACSCEEVHYEPRLQQITGSVASVRLDALLALAFKASRSSVISLIEEGKTFVNGRMVTSNGCRLKEGDLISVRGYGRFRYCGVGAETKKGRYFVTLEKYI